MNEIALFLFFRQGVLRYFSLRKEVQFILPKDDFPVMVSRTGVIQYCSQSTGAQGQIWRPSLSFHVRMFSTIRHTSTSGDFVTIYNS